MSENGKFNVATEGSMTRLLQLYRAYKSYATDDSRVRAYKYVTKYDYMSPWPLADNWTYYCDRIAPLCYAPGTFNEEANADATPDICGIGIHLTSLDIAVDTAKGKCWLVPVPMTGAGAPLLMTIVAVEFNLSDIASIGHRASKFRVYRCTSMAEIDPYSLKVKAWVRKDPATGKLHLVRRRLSPTQTRKSFPAAV